MATKRILNFKGFVNESYNVSEGRLSDWFGKLKNLVTGLTGFAKDFFNAVLSGEIKTYKSGPKAGLPVDMLFSQEFGSVLDQMMKYENGQMPVLSTAGKMASEAPLTTPVESVVGEAKIPLGWPGLEGDVRDIGVEEFKDDIRRIYWSKTNLGSKGRAKPLFIFGAPGIGKTQIVGGVADELGCDVVKLDLQFYNPEDFLGIPSSHTIEEPVIVDGILQSSGKGYTRANPPRKLPPDNRKNGKGGIIFMDELNRANKIVLNAIMQFVQEGRIDEYQLPDKWIIVACGNRPEEADVTEFDFALADRFTIKNFVPVPEDWADWARTNEAILPELVNFLMYNRELFHHMDAEKKSLNFPTPRSWTDGALNLYELIQYKFKGDPTKSWKDLDRTTIINTFSDQVGGPAAGKFVAYLDILKNISEKELIDAVKTPETARLIPEAKKDKSILYGLQEMTYNLVNDGSVEVLHNLMKYFERYEELEPLSVLYTKITKNNKDFSNVLSGTEDEQRMKKAALKMVASAIKKKGL
jgi:hypothetical protein